MVSKIRLSLIIISMLVAQVLGACQPETRQPVEITFVKRGYDAASTESYSLTTKAAVDAFEKRNPDIKVSIVGIPWGLEGDKALLTMLQARENINVLSINASDLADFARKGYLAEIDPFLTGDDRADFYASALETTTVDGKIYAWPLWLTAVAVYANPDMLTERGITPPTLDDPWTYEEFANAAQLLTYTKEDGTQVYGFSCSSAPGNVIYLPLFYIDGGRVLSPDGRRFTQNEPESISALQKIQDLTTVYKVTPPDIGYVDQAAVRQQFKEGKIAMMMDTPSVIPDLQASNVPFTVLPIPTGTGGKIVTTGGFGMYAVANAGTEDELAAAMEFARYLTGSDVASDVPGYQLAPGLRRSNQAYASDEPRSIVAKLVSFGIYELPYNIPTELRDRYESALQSIVTGEESPQQAMDAIAPDYQKYLDGIAR